jgi:acyl-CoA synthetase (NDP forming)
MFEKCIETILKTDAVDALLVSIVPHSVLLHTTDAEIERNTKNIAARIVSGADAIYNKLGKVLDEGGIPTFLTAKRAILCLNAFIRYRLMRKSDVFSDWLK